MEEKNKVQEIEKKEHSLLKKVTIIVVLLGIILFCYARLWSHKLFEIKEYPIIEESLTSNWNGFKIVQFSDIHYGRTTNEKELEHIINEINKTNAEIVVFTGDLFDNSINLSDKNIDDLKKVLSNIKAGIKKIAICGDSDYLNIELYKEIMSASGFQILENQNVLIYQNGTSPIQIAGISSMQKSEYDLKKSFETEETVSYKILLSHEPIILDEIGEEQINLILSGHSLGGLIQLPYIGSILKKNYTNDYQDGLYEKENTKLFVSSGIGTENYSLRILNNPSINFFRFYNY